MCVLLPDAPPGVFNPANPVAFPNNFPGEFFYDIADARILNLGGVGGDRADYRAALEGSFSNGFTELGQQITFARVRFTVDAAVNGTYRITHPFGQRTFANVVAGPAAIKVQEDIGIGAPGGPFASITTPGIGVGLAGGGLQQFLVRAVGGVPAPIAVGNELFIGDPNVDQAVVGGTQPDPNDAAQRFNAFMVEVDTTGTGNNFVQVGRTDNFALAGQVIGLTLTPPAQGTDFGVWKLATASTARTFSLRNLSPAAITPLISAIIPNSNNVPSPDFSIVPSTCGASVAAGATCTFDVIFNTTTTGATGATITISGGAGVPPVQSAVTGTGDGLAPTLILDQVIPFTKLSTQLISGTVSDINGVASVDVAVNGASQGTATITPGSPSSIWTKSITLPNANASNSISVTAADKAQAGGNVSAAQTATITNDTNNPVVDVTAPVSGSLVTNTTPTLSFTVIDANLAFTTVTVDNSAVTKVSGDTLGPLADGLHTVVVDAGDSAGNAGSATSSFTVDATGPVFAVSSPAAGDIRTASPLLTFTVTESHPANPDPMVVRLDGTVVAKVSGDTLGPFSPLTQGPHTLQIDSIDALGNPSSKLVVFNVILTDGDFDMDGSTSIADALQVLRVAVGLTTLTPNSDPFYHGDVAPLGVGGKPAPNGTIDIADALLILRKAVGIVVF